MKFLLDENVDARLVSFLSTFGHAVLAIARDYPYGLTDTDVLEVARAEQRILLTNDKDFGELIFRHHFSHCGIVLFRLKDETIENVQTRLQQVLTQYTDQLHHFLVITQKSVRIRKSLIQTAV